MIEVAMSSVTLSTCPLLIFLIPQVIKLTGSFRKLWTNWLPTCLFVFIRNCLDLLCNSVYFCRLALFWGSVRLPHWGKWKLVDALLRLRRFTKKGEIAIKYLCGLNIAQQSIGNLECWLLTNRISSSFFSLEMIENPNVWQFFFTFI